MSGEHSRQVSDHHSNFETLYMYIMSSLYPLASQLDEALQASSYAYQSFRAKNSIGELQLKPVPVGTFKRLKLEMVAQRSVSPNQFKVPRVLRDPQVIEFMLNAHRQEVTSDASSAA